MTLLGLLNQRETVARAFTKPFQDQVRQSIRDYEAESGTTKTGVYDKHVKTAKRYDGTVPYIFAQHEAILASLFEKLPEILITGRSEQNINHANALKALYEYLTDVCDLDEFIATSIWWFVLCGMAVSSSEYKIEVERYTPQLDQNGDPMLDEMGEPIEVPVYKTHDPRVFVEDLLKVMFSPESKYSVNGSDVPYIICERLVDVDEIEAVYGKIVDADEQLNVDNVENEKETEDLKRAKVLYYYGTLPKHCAEHLVEHELEWKYGVDYKVIHTKDTILYAEETPKPHKLVKLYGAMNKFFGFGIGKTLKPFQDDMSVRRGQKLRYADMYAYPQLLLESEGVYDAKALEDVRKSKPMVYKEKKPEYLVPPAMPDSITQADEASRSDAQFVSGQLELSSGAQDTNTVDTATGQQLFAQGQDKLSNKKRRAIAKYYREVVIQLFKLCRDNWEDHKELTFVNDDGKEENVTITPELLQDIDFDTDVDFNLDTISVNQDIMSQRWISLLDKVPMIPQADGKKIYQKALRESFKIQNPENYTLSDEELMPQVDEMGNPIEGEPTGEVMDESMPSQDPMMGEALAPQPY